MEVWLRWNCKACMHGWFLCVVKKCLSSCMNQASLNRLNVLDLFECHVEEEHENEERKKHYIFSMMNMNMKMEVGM